MKSCIEKNFKSSNCSLLPCDFSFFYQLAEWSSQNSQSRAVQFTIIPSEHSKNISDETSIKRTTLMKLQSIQISPCLLHHWDWSDEIVSQLKSIYQTPSFCQVLGAKRAAAKQPTLPFWLGSLFPASFKDPCRDPAPQQGTSSTAGGGTLWDVIPVPHAVRTCTTPTAACSHTLSGEQLASNFTPSSV